MKSAAMRRDTQTGNSTEMTVGTFKKWLFLDALTVLEGRLAGRDQYRALRGLRALGVMQSRGRGTLEGSDAFSGDERLSPSGATSSEVGFTSVPSPRNLETRHYKYCCSHRAAGCCCPQRGMVGSRFWPSISMSIRLGRVAPALPSPEPRGLSQLLPGDELRVRHTEPSFLWSALIRAGVGRGRGANSRVLGLSRGLMSKGGVGLGAGGAGALRRWGTWGWIVDGSGRRGMSSLSGVPERKRKINGSYLHGKNKEP